MNQQSQTEQKSAVEVSKPGLKLGLLRCCGVIAIAVLLTGCAANPTGGPRRTITVVGVGRAHGAPDYFELRTGVSNTDKDMDKARVATADASRRIIEAAQRFPLDAKRSHTTWFTTRPHYEEKTHDFKGYQVEQDFVFVTTDLTKAEDIVIAVLKAGAKNVNVSFETDKSEALLAEARIAALRDAREKATAMAGAYNEKVERVIRISNQNDQSSGQGGLFQDEAPRSRSEADAADRVYFLTPSQIEAEASILVEFELGPPGG